MKWRRAFVLSSILLATVYVTLYGGTISYVLFFSSITILVISVAYLVYVYIEFKIYQKIEGRSLVKGQEVPYYFNLSNESRLPFTSVAVSFLKDMQEVKGVEDGKEYCLLPGESVKHQTRIIANYRGEYEMGIDKVILQDCFELFTLTYCCKSKISVKVLPRIVKLESLAFVSEQEDAKKDRFGAAHVEEVPSGDIRNYVSGDDPKRIHWKLSACTDELVVKQYTKLPQLERLVLLDLSKQEGSVLHQIRVEDKVIECAVAILHYMLEHRIPVRVCYDAGSYKDQLIVDHNEFMVFYKRGATFRFHKECRILHLMEEVQKGRPKGASYIVITCRMTKELCAKCLEITENQGEVTVISVEEEGHTAETLKMPGVRWYTIHPDDDLSAKLSGKGW